MSAKGIQVAIIGGGLAGPVLALLLKKQHGIRCTIYELRDEPVERGNSLALSPNALRVLQHIGIYDELRFQGYTFEAVALNNGYGQQLAKFLNGSQKLYNFRSLRIHRKQVQKALLNELSAQGIQIKYGMKLVGLRELDDGVEMRYANGQVTTADYVVGSDGLYSCVRQHITSHKPSYSGLFAITGIYYRDQMHASVAEYHLPGFFFGNSGFMAIMPCSLDGNEVSFFSSMEAPDLSRDEWKQLAADKQQLHDILMERFCLTNNWPTFIVGMCKGVSPSTLSLWPIMDVPTIEHWFSSKGRVIVVGDAAHAISPQGGQGAAMAFEDVETLAYTMSQPVFVVNRLKLLHIWETHRKARMEKVKVFTQRNASLRHPARSWFKQTLKEYLLWGAFKYMGPSAGLQWLYGYNAEEMVGMLSVEC